MLVDEFWKTILGSPRKVLEFLSKTEQSSEYRTVIDLMLLLGVVRLL